MRHSDQLTPAVIAACCDQGDEMAIEVFRRTGEVLGIVLANYASVVGPEAFVLTGGIPKAGHWLLDPLRQSFNEHIFYNLQDKVKVLVSSLNDHERDVLGASALAWEVKEYSLYV
jgi:glucokinase